MNEFKDFLDNIGFNYYRPFDICPEVWCDAMELNNTRWNCEHERIFNRVLRDFLFSIPRNTTYLIAGILNKAVYYMDRDDCFLSVGMGETGFPFIAGMLGNDKICIGIDNYTDRKIFRKHFARLAFRTHEFFTMSLPRYFRRKHDVNQKIGVVYWDYSLIQLHICRGIFGEMLRLVERYLSDNAIIFFPNLVNKKVYKAVFKYIKNSIYDYDVLLFNIPNLNDAGIHITYYNGLCIVQKGDLK